MIATHSNATPRIRDSSLRETALCVRTASVALLLMMLADASAHADSKTSVENANNLCQVFHAKGLASKPCSVSAAKASIEVTIDMGSLEARKVCQQIVALAAEKNIKFDSGWKINIFSPYSGSNTTAFCRL